MACIAIVLNGPKTKNGRRVFESFVEQNRQSFWNRELVTASESLIYMGFMRPSTLFVSGATEQLSIMKDAWARRILKPAHGYTITSLGDLGAIQQVEQMHFVPLGDVICDAISQLNRNGQAATENTIRQHVARHCAHVAPPNTEMVRQTIGSLLATGFVYKMGEHYFVSVPTNSPPKMKATVECQTSILNPNLQIQIQTEKLDRSEKSRKGGLFSRLFSRGGRPSNAMPQPASNIPISFSPAAMFTPGMIPPPLPAFPSKNKFPTYHNDLAKECVAAATATVASTRMNNEQDIYLENNAGFKHNQKPANGNSNPNSNQQKKANRRRRREAAKLMSSSSECLNYGPIDPPEFLPGSVEVIDDVVAMTGTTTSRRQKRRQGVPLPRPRQAEAWSAERRAPMYPPIVRTSTPIGSDSAYSPSPVTDSNDDEGSSNSNSEPELPQNIMQNNIQKENDNNHTYMNLVKFSHGSNDSTQFEDVTCAQEEPKILASQIRGVFISNV